MRDCDRHTLLTLVSVVFLCLGRTSGGPPQENAEAVFSGDTLFIGGVGEPTGTITRIVTMHFPHITRIVTINEPVLCATLKDDSILGLGSEENAATFDSWMAAGCTTATTSWASLG